MAHEKMDGHDPSRDKSELVQRRAAFRHAGDREQRTARNGAGVNEAVQHRNAEQFGLSGEENKWLEANEPFKHDHYEIL